MDHTLYGDTLGPEGSSGDTYLKMEAANANSMVEGFTGGQRKCELAAAKQSEPETEHGHTRSDPGPRRRLRSPAAIEDVTFEVEAGKRVALLGPNGGGKTTLLRVLLGELRPMRGTVEVRGAAPPFPRRSAPASISRSRRSMSP